MQFQLNTFKRPTSAHPQCVGILRKSFRRMKREDAAGRKFLVAISIAVSPEEVFAFEDISQDKRTGAAKPNRVLLRVFA